MASRTLMLAQIDLERQPVEQGRRRTLVLGRALVERHQAESGRRPQCQPVALQQHLARIERARQARCRAGRQPLGHGHQQHTAVGLGQEAAIGNRPPRVQGGGEVETAQQATIRDVERQPTHRRCRRQQPAQQGQPGVAHRPGMGAQRRRHPLPPDRPRTAPPPAPRRPTRTSPPRARRSRPEQLRDRTIDAHGRARIVERIAPQPVAQGGRRHPAQMRVADLDVAVEAGQRARGADQRQLAAQAVGAEPDAELRRPLDRRIGHHDIREPTARGHEAAAHPALLLLPLRNERRRVALERVAPAHHLDPVGKVVRRPHLDRQAEPVEELRPQLALFRVTAADQHEPGRVADAQALALDHVLARRRHVEQQVDEMVLQQVGLVDVEEAAMRAGQQTGLERLLAAGQRALQVQRADDAILGRPSGRSTTGTGTRCALALAIELQSGHWDRSDAGSQL